MTPGMFIPLPGCAKFRYFLQWNFAVVGTPKLQDVSGFRTQSLIGALLGGSHEQTGKLGTKNVRSTQKTGTTSEKQASNMVKFSQHWILISKIEKIWSLKAVCLPSVQLTGWWFGTWILFFHILGRIIPTDCLTNIFQRGWNHQPGFVLVWIPYIPSRIFGCWEKGLILVSQDVFFHCPVIPSKSFTLRMQMILYDIIPKHVNTFNVRVGWFLLSSLLKRSQWWCQVSLMIYIPIEYPKISWVVTFFLVWICHCILPFVKQTHYKCMSYDTIISYEFIYIYIYIYIHIHINIIS